MTWIEREQSWHRTEVAYCEVTGQLLPRRYWQFTDDGRTIKARDPHCEDLYWRYLRESPQSSAAMPSDGPADADAEALPRSR